MLESQNTRSFLEYSALSSHSFQSAFSHSSKESQIHNTQNMLSMGKIACIPTLPFRLLCIPRSSSLSVQKFGPQLKGSDILITSKEMWLPNPFSKYILK